MNDTDFLLNKMVEGYSSEAELAEWEERQDLATAYMYLKFYIDLVKNYKPKWKYTERENALGKITKAWIYPYFEEGELEENEFWYFSMFNEFMLLVYEEIENGKHVVSFSNRPWLRPKNEKKITPRRTNNSIKSSKRVEELKNICENWYDFYYHLFTDVKQKNLKRIEKKLVKKGIDPEQLWCPKKLEKMIMADVNSCHFS